LRCIAFQYCHANSKIRLSIFNSTEATRFTRYVRKAKVPYTAACPANNAKMFRDSQIDSASMDKQRKEQTKNNILKDLIAIQSQDEEGLFEVLEGFMGNVDARMVPKILEIIRRKTSAAPALSEEQRNEQRWQHLRKELQTMKSCDKKGYATLVADQIEDHHMAEKILPKVLDKVRSTTPGKIRVAEAFVPGGRSLNLKGRGVSRSAIDKKKAAAAKVRKAVKSKVGTPMFRRMLNAKTPGSSRRKLHPANFEAAAHAPRTSRTPLETISRRVSFGPVAYCSPVLEEAGSDSMMLDETPPEPPMVATSLPISPPKDGRQPNRSTAHLPSAQSPPPCRNKRRKPSLTSQKQIDSCRKDLGEQYIAHLEENKETMTPRDRRPFLASVANHEKQIVEKVIGMAIDAQEYKNTYPLTRPSDPASPIAATSLPTSPPKDGRHPNRTTAHLPAAQSSPPCRTKRRKPTLTFQKKIDSCRKDLGEQYIAHLEGNKETMTPRDRRPFLASVAHHEKKIVENVLGMAINGQEYKNIRVHAKYPGKFVEARKPRVFRNKIKKELLLKMIHHLDDHGNLQRLAVGRKIVQIMGGQQCVELDNVSRNKTCAVLAAEFIVKVGEQWDIMVMAEDGTFQPLPESAERCQCLEKGTGRHCMKVRGHDKRPENGSGEEDETDPKHYKHKFTPPGSISLTSAMELVGTLTGEELKAMCGLDDIKVAKGMENFKRKREIADLYFSGARKDQMILRIDDHELFCQTDFVPHLQVVSANNCNCLTCGFCNESKYCVDGDKSRQQLKSLGATAVHDSIFFKYSVIYDV
jgi:hypothetical protein